MANGRSLMDGRGSMIEREAIESRTVRSGYDYWLGKCQGLEPGLVPARRDLDPVMEIPRLVPHMMLKDVQASPPDFRYRLIGTALRRHMAQDWTGIWLSTISFQAAGSTVWENNAWVRDNRVPRYARPPYVGPHKDFMYVESVILPLASDHRQVDMLMFFVDFIGRKPISVD